MLGFFRASQRGVNSASRPVPAPGRNRAAMTTIKKRTVRIGMKIFDARPMPESTPIARTRMATIHTMAKATAI